MNVDELAEACVSGLIIEAASVWGDRLSKLPLLDKVEHTRGNRAAILVMFSYHLGVHAPEHPSSGEYSQCLLKRFSDAIGEGEAEVVRIMAKLIADTMVVVLEDRRSRGFEIDERYDSIHGSVVLGAQFLEFAFGVENAAVFGESLIIQSGLRLRMATESAVTRAGFSADWVARTFPSRGR